MANSWPTQYDRRDHSSSGAPSGDRAGQWQNTGRPDIDTATQNCTCALCSATRHNGPPVWDIMEYQNPWPPGVGVIVVISSTDSKPLKDANFSHANQIDSHAGVAAVGGNARIQQQFVAPQVPGHAGSSLAPWHEEVQFYQTQINAELDQAQALEMSITETFRRLAVRFVDNPESVFNVVRLEPSASGRFRVVIVLEVADIL